MKPRARRLVLLTAAAGTLVIVGLMAFNWPTVHDHAEAWWFQLTTETEAIRPDTPYLELCKKSDSYSWHGIRDLLRLLASTSGRLVIGGRDVYQVMAMVPARNLTPDFALHLLRSEGCRVLEQRFPRSAYVVIADQ